MNLKDKKTAMIVGGVVLGLGVLIYFLFKNKPLGVEVNEINPDDINPQPENNLDMDLVLKQGSEGAEVAEMQRILIEKYGQDLGTFGDNQDGIDGIFGTVTLAGLLKAKQVSEIALKDL
jgi:peptidoglycan hydrolase-like protein with peptidoglycan-binding domain